MSHLGGGLVTQLLEPRAQSGTEVGARGGGV